MTTRRSNVIKEGGLRYASRATGSQFASGSSGHVSSMSCFKCGAHRLPSEMQSKRILGKSQRVCAPSCPERKK